MAYKKLNNTEKYLLSQRRKFNKTHTGAGAFLPTVGEYRQMNSSEKRFYARQVQTLKAPSHYQKGRDIYKARAITRLANHAYNLETTPFKGKRYEQVSNYYDQAKEATLMLEAGEHNFYSSNNNLSKREKMAQIKQGRYSRAENLKDYTSLLRSQIVSGVKSKNGNAFKFGENTQEEIKHKALRYDAYQSNQTGSENYTVIVDSMRGAKNGSPRGGLVKVTQRPLDEVLDLLAEGTDPLLL